MVATLWRKGVVFFDQIGTSRWRVIPMHGQSAFANFENELEAAQKGAYFFSREA